MTSKTSGSRLVFSICSIGLVCLFAGGGAAYADTLSANVISLSPSESSQFEPRRSEVGLSAIAQSINTGVETNRRLAEEAAKEGTLDFMTYL